METTESDRPPEWQIDWQTHWKGLDAKNDARAFFCPLCRSPRRISFSPDPLPRHYAQVALTSLIFTLATWGWFEWKGIVSFLPLWIGFEAVYRAKARAALTCTHCGFDPFLYLTDVERARREIETHWKRKFAEKGIPYPGTPAGDPDLTKLSPDANDGGKATLS